MKVLGYVLLIGFSMMGSTLMSQEREIGKPDAKVELEKLSKLLDLEENQKAEVLKILEQKRHKLQDAKLDRASMREMTQEERREKMMEARTKREEVDKEINRELKEVLTTDQMNTYLSHLKKLREQQREKRMQRRMNNQQPDMHQEESW